MRGISVKLIFFKFEEFFAYLIYFPKFFLKIELPFELKK